MKENPNTQYFFDNKIARTVLENDLDRNPTWLNVITLLDRFPYHRYHLSVLHRHCWGDYMLFDRNNIIIPFVEEWVIENNIFYPTTCNEDEWVLFKLRWL